MARKIPIPRARFSTAEQQATIDALSNAVRQLNEVGATTGTQGGTAGATSVTVIEGGGGSTTPGTGPIEMPHRVESFTAEGSYTAVILTWAVATYEGHAATQIYRHTVDDFSTASLLTETVATSYADPVGPDQRYYYWARHTNSDGTPGPTNDSLGTLASTYKGSNEEAEYIDNLITQKVTADYISAMELTAVRLYTASINIDQHGNPTSNMFWLRQSGQLYAEGATLKSLTVLDENGDVSMQSGRTLWASVEGDGKPADNADATDYSDSRVANDQITEQQVRSSGYLPRDYEITTYIDVAYMNAMFAGEIFAGHIYAENIEGDVYEEYYFDNGGVGWTSEGGSISSKKRLVRFTIPAVPWPRRFIHKSTRGWYDFDGSSTESCYIGVYLVVNDVYTRVASWDERDDNDTYTVSMGETIGPVIPADTVAYVDYARYAGSDGSEQMHLSYMRFAMYKDTGVSDITDTFYYYGEYDPNY